MKLTIATVGKPLDAVPVFDKSGVLLNWRCSGFQILEYSIVSIPANANAIISKWLRGPSAFDWFLPVAVAAGAGCLAVALSAATVVIGFLFGG